MLVQKVKKKRDKNKKRNNVFYIYGSICSRLPMTCVILQHTLNPYTSQTHGTTYSDPSPV